MASTIKAVWFDFMGTCLDWHSIIVESLPSGLSEERKSTFALHWRQAYFDSNTQRLNEGKPVEDFDDAQRRILDEFLQQNKDVEHLFTTAAKQRLVAAWHLQKAWPDVSEALRKLRQEQGLETFVHANGSTRLQLDLVRCAGLQFDMLFSSALLDIYKPDPESYRKVLGLLKLKADEVVMVAAHASDLRGAKAAGLRTVYIYRWTDDILEDQETIKLENDAYLQDMSTLPNVISSLQPRK